jgi:ketosteroid isomerase-like protein
MSGKRLGHRMKSFREALPQVACALALLLPLSAAGGIPQDTGDPLHMATRVELDVVKVILAQEKAWNAGDIESYVRGYKDSPDTLFVGKTVSKGYKQIMEDYKRNYSTRGAMGTLTFSGLDPHQLSDTYAVCIGNYHLDRSKKDGGPADGMFSLVLEKTGDGWKIVLDHTT